MVDQIVEWDHITVRFHIKNEYESFVWYFD